MLASVFEAISSELHAVNPKVNVSRNIESVDFNFIIRVWVIYKNFNNAKLTIICRKKIEQVQTFVKNSNKYVFLTVINLQKDINNVLLRNRLHFLSP
ncbi:hypothetical protein D3C86_1751130 [compost metagenome]